MEEPTSFRVQPRNSCNDYTQLDSVSTFYFTFILNYTNIRIVKKELTLPQIRVRRWVEENRGMLTRIAVASNCTVGYVNQVAYGRSTSRLGKMRIERLLRDAGWPGI
jgi:hypothetical protein